MSALLFNVQCYPVTTSNVAQQAKMHFVFKNIYNDIRDTSSCLQDVCETFLKKSLNQRRPYRAEFPLPVSVLKPDFHSKSSPCYMIKQKLVILCTHDWYFMLFVCSQYEVYSLSHVDSFT